MANISKQIRAKWICLKVYHYLFLIHPVEGICQTEDYVIIYARKKFNEDQSFQFQSILQLKCWKNIFLDQISNRIFGFYSFLYIKLFPITPLLWLSPSYKIDPMSNLLFIKCSTIQNIIQTMVTYDSVDRLKFLSTMQVLEMAKNNIVLLGNFIWFMLFIIRKLTIIMVVISETFLNSYSS